MTSSTITIITICKNNLTDLIRTLDSILIHINFINQLVIVDGSIDKSFEQALQPYSELNILYLHSSDRNISHAWNIGLSRSISSHTLILNSGDLLNSIDLSFVFPCLEPDKVSCFPSIISDPSGGDSLVFLPNLKKLYNGMHLPHCSTFVPTYIYRSFGQYPEISQAMDFFFFRSLLNSFGEQLFLVFPNLPPTSIFFTGGTSSVNYLTACRNQQLINMLFGVSPILALFNFITYYLKFLVKKFLF